ncbi:FIMAH domain-containing protein [Micromonospora chersina]|uniref:FIMAH domain-containing protein n=1 Tax=Micromonospora chersina TaxID=47854 RepID=UPI003722C0A3
MSAPPDPSSADLAQRTSVLPLVRPAGSRHRAPDDGSRLVWLASGGAALALVAALLALAFTGGEDGAAPVTGATVAVGPSVPAEPSTPVTDEVSPTPTASPSPSSPAPRRSADPAALAAGLRAVVDGLVEQRQLRPRDGKELRKRLREVEEKIADGEPEEARAKLREFAEDLIDLRREDKLSARGYDLLVAGATQLAQALPAR